MEWNLVSYGKLQSAFIGVHTLLESRSMEVELSGSSRHESRSLKHSCVGENILDLRNNVLQVDSLQQ
jgi:hypothetical protein